MKRLRRLARQKGATLVVGLILLTMVTLLSLAATGSAHVETLLAQNESFRENAASAASAGVEVANRAIMTSSEPAAVPARLTGRIPESNDRFEVELRFLGFETALPREPAELLAGAQFEILSTGFSARNAVDRLRAGVLWVAAAPAAGALVDCEPLAPRHCHHLGELERLSWQHVSLE
jgi:hypothetical protein